MEILTITDAAAARLQDIMAAQEPKPEAMLLSVPKKGCSGMTYDLQILSKLSDAPRGADKVTRDGITLVIDPAATMFVLGTTMDYKTDALKSGFEFSNPNATGTCGCGESFTVAKPSPQG